MTTLVGVVCEAAADQRTGCGLADRVLVDFLNIPASSCDLATFRSWVGAEGTSAGFLPWTQVGKLAKQREIKAHGHFDGLPGRMDAHAARLALLLLHSFSRRPDAVILLRDQDGHDERLDGLNQARNDPKNPFPGSVIVGFASRMREAWVLAGFVAKTADEQRRLAEWSARPNALGFDPTIEPERLQSNDESNRRSPKRVLRHLTKDDKQREEQCWTETDLTVLRQRGTNCGLTSYLAEVEKLLVPFAHNNIS